jgi:hypothetical protein
LDNVINGLSPEEVAKRLVSVQPMDIKIDWDKLAEELAVLHSMHDRPCLLGVPESAWGIEDEK